MYLFLWMCYRFAHGSHAGSADIPGSEWAHFLERASLLISSMRSILITYGLFATTMETADTQRAQSQSQSQSQSLELPLSPEVSPATIDLSGPKLTRKVAMAEITLSLLQFVCMSSTENLSKTKTLFRHDQSACHHRHWTTKTLCELATGSSLGSM